MSTTTDLSRFGSRERGILIDLLQAWRDQGLPEDFDNTEVTVMFNLESGYVFLTNADYQVAALNGDRLESFYSTPYEGREGFFDDLMAEYEHMVDDDRQYMDDLGWTTGRITT